MSKIIHQIWLGPKTPPKWCMDSWKIDYIKNNPDWKYMLWTENEVIDLNLINRNAYDREPTVRGKSDILRYELLYQYGGIFIDADSLSIDPKKSLNNLIKNISFFACREPKNKQFIANGVIYSEKRNNVILEMINILKEKYFDLKKKYSNKYQIWQVTNQPMFTEICERNKIHVYPSEYFYPESFIKNNINIPIDEIKNKYKNSYMYQYWLSHYD
tara:strand:- start:3480 stop:4124 length:645 start_codon:yes stop_codon:yes gene_type:complete